MDAHGRRFISVGAQDVREGLTVADAKTRAEAWAADALAAAAYAPKPPPPHAAIVARPAFGSNAVVAMRCRVCKQTEELIAATDAGVSLAAAIQWLADIEAKHAHRTEEAAKR